jgi:hypothetical protein
LKSGRSAKNHVDGVGRNRVTNSDLPDGAWDRFAKDVLPLVHETSGALDPWEFPDDEYIIDAWNIIFNGEHPITGGAKDNLFIAVKSLVSSSHSTNSVLTAHEYFCRRSVDIRHGYTSLRPPLKKPYPLNLIVKA